MATTGKWKGGTYAPGSPSTLLDTQIASLASGSMSTASNAVDNDTNHDLYADLELNLASFDPTAPGRCDVYILCSIDGTNYPPATAAALRNQGSQLLCSFPLDDASALQRVVVRNVLLPNCKFKVCLDNQSNAALPSSATLKMITSNIDLNG